MCALKYTVKKFQLKSHCEEILLHKKLILDLQTNSMKKYASYLDYFSIWFEKIYYILNWDFNSKSWREKLTFKKIPTKQLFSLYQNISIEKITN